MDPSLALIVVSAQAAISVACICFVAFFKGYGNEKGKNLATHEDIDKLVNQVEAVTKATKDIEAKISIHVWNRQKQWEIKKEALFEITKQLSVLLNELTTLDSTYSSADQSGYPESPSWTKAKNSALRQWTVVAASFGNAHAVAALVCGSEAVEALKNVNALVRNIANEIINKNNLGMYDSSLPELTKLAAVFTKAIRKELQIDETQVTGLPQLAQKNLL